MKRFSLGLWLALLICLTGSVVLAFFIYREKEREKKINNEIEILKKESEEISNANRDLYEKIAYFETPEFKEGVAKEKLNLQKPEEKVVVIKPNVAAEIVELPTDNNAKEEMKSPEPNYKKWWRNFFNY